MADRRAERRRNAGRPDEDVKSYGAPTETPKPTTRRRPKPGPADDATRRRAIEEKVERGKEETRRSRAAEKTDAPKPKPRTVGTPGRSTYDTLKERQKDTMEAADEAEGAKKR